MGKSWYGFRTKRAAKKFANKKSNRRLLKRPPKDIKKAFEKKGKKYIVVEYW